jgi:hypothetical protein
MAPSSNPILCPSLGLGPSSSSLSSAALPFEFPLSSPALLLLPSTGAPKTPEEGLAPNALKEDSTCRECGLEGATAGVDVEEEASSEGRAGIGGAYLYELEEYDELEE